MKSPGESCLAKCSTAVYWNEPFLQYAFVCLTLQTHRAFGGLPVNCDLYTSLSRRTTTVSYTHLTLPTIYSV